MLQKIFVGVIAIALFGCVSKRDIDVDSAKSTKVNLQGYKNYQIVDGSGIIHDSQKIWIPNSNFDVNAEIKQMITTRLGRKGKMPVTQNPDFYVVYATGQDMNALNIKIDRKGRETIRNIPLAALAIVFVDATTGELIWVSYSTGQIKSGLSIKDRKKRLYYTINKMLDGV